MEKIIRRARSSCLIEQMSDEGNATLSEAKFLLFIFFKYRSLYVINLIPLICNLHSVQSNF